MIFTALAFIFTLGVLIVIHEYGHYRVAVACGVKVLRFSVGFGRPLWRRQASPDSTEFVVAMLPLGGYVRMLDERETAVRPDQRHLAFNNKPLWQRTAIVAAGPIANLALAVLLFAAGHWIGVDEPKAVLGAPPAHSLAERAGLHAGDWAQAASRDGNEWRDLRSMNDLRWEITQAVMDGEPLMLRLTDVRGRQARTVSLPLHTLDTREFDAETLHRLGLAQLHSEPVMGRINADGAAHDAGLREGDRVLSVDGRPVQEAARLRELIRANGADGQAQPMTWRIERDGRTLDIAVTPAVVTHEGQRIGRIGAYIGAPPEIVTVRYGPLEGFTKAAVRTWDMSWLTLRMLGKMVIGDASLKNLSGPITIADYAGQSARLGVAYFLGFLAIVSVSLGVLNLLPLPMLDGGHLMYYLFEAVTGRPVSELWLERLQRGGVAIMLMMMSLALYNDVARFLGLY